MQVRGIPLRVTLPGSAGTNRRRRARLFSSNGIATAQPAIDVKSLHAKIGELTLENDFLEAALNKAGLLSAKR